MPGLAPNSNINPLATLSAADAAVRGKADPNSIVGVANTARSPQEAATNIQAIVHSGNMLKMYDALHGMDPSMQAQAWDGLHPAEQDSLRSLGYHPPNPDLLSHSGAGGSGGSWWSQAMGFVNRDVLHPVESGVGRVLQDVPHAASDTLNAMGSGLRATQHIYRAAHVVSEEGIAGAEGWGSAFRQASGSGVSFDPNAFRDIFSPSAWSHAWDETQNGNYTLDPAIGRHLVAQYGQKQVRLALQVANNGPDSVIQGAPAAQQKALFNQLNDPKFQSLVTQVSNSRMSFGRNLVGEQYMTQHPLAGKLLSGGLDAATDVVTDPYLALGKGMEVFRGAHFGIEAANYSRAMDLMQNSKEFDSYVQRIEPYLKSGNYGELGKIDPRLEGLAETLRASNIDSADKFKDWLANENGLKSLFGGLAAKISHSQVILPHLSPLAWGKSYVKDALQTAVDRIADGKTPDFLLHPDDVWGAGDHNALGSIDKRVNHWVGLLQTNGVDQSYSHIPGILNPGRLIRRMSTYIPDQDYISYANGKADLTNFRRYAQGVLPSKMVDEGSDLFVHGTESQRRAMIRGLIQQWGHITGVYKTADGARAMDDLLGAIESEDMSQAYGINGYDMIDHNGIQIPSAIYGTQRSGAMRIILPSAMRSMARSQSVLSLAGVNPFNILDRSMVYWRTLILDRPGFAVRVALDENLNRIMRSGPKAFFGSMFANGAARTMTDDQINESIERQLAAGAIQPGDVKAVRAGMTAASYKKLLPVHPVERALHILANRAPEGVRNNWRSLEEFYGGVMGATAHKWVRQAENKTLRALGLGEYIDGATHLATHQNLADDALQDIISHMTGTPGYTLTPGSIVKHLREGIDGKPGYFRKTSGYSQVDLGNPLYVLKWQASLDHIARDEMGRAVLHGMVSDYSREDQIASVMHVLKSPEYRYIKDSLDRSRMLRDGRVVGPGGATQEEADRDLAESVVDNTNAHLRGGEYDPDEPGPLLQELAYHMIDNGMGPDSDLLDDVIRSGRALPKSVVGPDLVPMNSKVEGFLSHSFEWLAGKPMNWMARQPHLIHQYTEALRDTRVLALERGMVGGIKPGVAATVKDLTPAGEQYASDLAFERAIKAVIPYIHNPALRTYFEDNHQVIMPFLFAQRQFLLRWGRTVADSPSTVRKIQLGMNGLRSMGIIQKDANGNDYFYYPGSQYVTEMLSTVLNHIGVHSSIPFAVPFTGEVKYLMPGLANPVTPSVGPFAAVSMKALSRVFPQLQGINQAVLGQGASENAIEQFSPTLLNRLVAAFGPASAGSEKASAIAMMLKFMDANGQLPDLQNAKPGEIEQMISRVDTGSTEIMAVRAALGFGLPSTPTAQLDPQGLDARYKELLADLPYDQALSEFYREHPNASAYTIGTTEGATSGNIPSTAEDLSFTNNHVQFAKDYPAAFPWLAPRSPGQFSLTEFLEQEATGQRSPLPIWDQNYGAKSVLANIANSQASKIYYAAVDQYDAAYSSTTDSNVHKQQTQIYDSWKQSFEAAHPLFAQYLTSQQGKNNRETTIQQVRNALSDPALPDSPAVPGLKTMIAAYDQFKGAYNQYLGNNTTAAYDTKVNIKNTTIAWGNNYIKTHGRVADFWNTIIRPEVDETTG